MWFASINLRSPLIFFLNFNYVYGVVHVNAVLSEAQQRELEELQAALSLQKWMLGTRFRSFEGALPVLNHWTISLVPGAWIL